MASLSAALLVLVAVAVGFFLRKPPEPPNPGEFPPVVTVVDHVADGVDASFVCFSHDGNQLLVAGSARAGAPCRIQLFDVIHGKNPRTFTLPAAKQTADSLRAAAFSNKVLFVGSGDGKLHRWDLAASTKQPVTWQAHRVEVTALALSGDGNDLYSASADGSVRRWDASHAGKELACFLGEGEVRSLSLNSDGKVVRLLCGRGDGVVLLDPRTLNSRGMKPLPANFPHAEDPQTHLAAHPGGLLCAWSDQIGFSSGGAINRFMIDAKNTKAHRRKVVGLSLSPDGSRLASVGADNQLRVWRMSDRKCIHEEDVADARSIAFHPAGTHLAVATNQGARLIGVKTMRK